ncbi:nucleoside deaminase [Brevibacterium permense]|uniref:tRNA-specific adenosine deaminase n=1 Tax=Brevibacterium permense TaxID=234834 RepID=A0ABN2ALH0_9MICO
MTRLDEWMGHALAEAALAPAHDDVPVGAVVIDSNGVIIGRGHNRREVDADPLGHAELMAISAAASARGEWRLDGCTLVVTLEPCAMCAGALVGSRIDRVVFGAYDDKAGAVGSVWDLLRDRAALHHPQVTSGVRAEESRALLRGFFGARR